MQKPLTLYLKSSSVLIYSNLFLVCRNPGEDNKMLVCDMCDKGYHTFCLQPIVDTIPTSGWRCKVSLCLCMDYKWAALRRVETLCFHFCFEPVTRNPWVFMDCGIEECIGFSSHQHTVYSPWNDAGARFNHHDEFITWV